MLPNLAPHVFRRPLSRRRWQSPVKLMCFYFNKEQGTSSDPVRPRIMETMINRVENVAIGPLLRSLELGFCLEVDVSCAYSRIV
jgi:hypothetical protein